MGASLIGTVGFAAADSPAPTPTAGATGAASPSPSDSDSDAPWRGGPWGYWHGGSTPPWAGPWGGGGAFPFNVGDALHGQVVVAKSGGGTQTILIQKGQVTAVSATSLTVKSSDGFTATYAVTGDTAVDGDKGRISAVAQNADVVVSAVQDGGTDTAQSILDTNLLDPDATHAPTDAPSPGSGS